MVSEDAADCMQETNKWNPSGSISLDPDLPDCAPDPVCTVYTEGES